MSRNGSRAGLVARLAEARHCPALPRARAVNHLEVALTALRTNNQSAALDALENAGRADGCAGATARWASRAIQRGQTDAGIARVIVSVKWALEQE